MSSYQKLLKTGQALAKKARELDDLERYEEAKQKYLEAAETLMQFIRINRNAQIKKVIEPKIMEYVKRAKQLSGIEEEDYEEDFEEDLDLSDDDGDKAEPKKKKVKIKKGDPKISEAIADTIITEKPDIKRVGVK